jgi:hypothetical protein
MTTFGEENFGEHLNIVIDIEILFYITESEP